jgi:hypothetical protein
VFCKELNVLRARNSSSMVDTVSKDSAVSWKSADGNPFAANERLGGYTLRLPVTLNPPLWIY